MNLRVTNNASDEKSLVNLYMDLTGATESRARSVFMYVCCHPKETIPVSLEFGPDAVVRSRRRQEPIAADITTVGWLARPATSLASD